MLNKETLLSKIKELSNETKQGNKEFPKCTFLPDGNHIGRIIQDPNDEFICEYYARGYFNNGIRDVRSIPKNKLPENFEDRLDSVAKQLSSYRIFKYGSKFVSLVYFWLENTDSKSENWQPGNLYCVIGNRVFSKSLKQFLINISQTSSEEVVNLLNPKSAGFALKIQYFKSKTQGEGSVCNISVDLKNMKAYTIPEIDLKGQGYIPLEDAYIKPGFFEDKYTRLLNNALQDLKEKEDYVNKKNRDSSVDNRDISKQENTEIKKKDNSKENTEDAKKSVWDDLDDEIPF